MAAAKAGVVTRMVRGLLAKCFATEALYDTVNVLLCYMAKVATSAIQLILMSPALRRRVRHH